MILLFFAVGFTALTPYVEEAGAFFSYVRTALGFPAGIGIAFVALVSYVAIEAGVYGLLGPAGGAVDELFGGPALPWWLFAAAAFADTPRTGAGKERHFFSARHGVGVEAPLGWALSLHTGYPTVLVAHGSFGVSLGPA